MITFEKHTAPRAYSKHAPGAYDLENSFRLCMVQDHKVLIWPWTISRGQNLQKALKTTPMLMKLG